MKCLPELPVEYPRTGVSHGDRISPSPRKGWSMGSWGSLDRPEKKLYQTGVAVVWL